MLQALLPQVREFADQVEVWVLDNASTDDTARVLEEAKNLGPFRVKQQRVNIGPTRNIVDGPANLARGQYVWVLGDHNLLTPGALGKLLQQLQEHPEYELFYINFRAGVFPGLWPTAAVGGYDGPFAYLGNPEITSGRASEWWQLLRPYSALCTQNYVHVVRTSIWRSFWSDRPIGPDYSSSLTTYPHTTMLVRTLIRAPAVVVADPLITIFNGAQSWSNPGTQVKVYFTGLPGLLDDLLAAGLSDSKLQEFIRNFHQPEATRVAVLTLQRLGRLAGLRLLLQHALHKSYCRRALVSALPDGLMPRATNMWRKIIYDLRNYRTSYFYNCRPMRWFRKQTCRHIPSSSVDLPATSACMSRRPEHVQH